MRRNVEWLSSTALVVSRSIYQDKKKRRFGRQKWCLIFDLLLFEFLVRWVKATKKWTIIMGIWGFKIVFRTRDKEWWEHYGSGNLSQGRACGHPWKVKRGGQFGRENCAAVHLINPLLPCCGVKVQRAKWHDVLTQVAWLKMQVWLTHKIINFALHQILQLRSVLWCQKRMQVHLLTQSCTLWNPPYTGRWFPILIKVLTFLLTSLKSPQLLDNLS